MANENKQVDDLLADDDDPTAELEILSLPPTGASGDERESDATTSGYGKDNDATVVQGKSIPELESDLDSRSKTIGRLQHDIEQLRSKWMGLEAEIGAREDIVNDLSTEVDDLKNQVTLKSRLIEERDSKIASLKSRLRERDEARESLEQQQADLEQQLAEQRSARAENSAALDQSKKEIEEFAARLQDATDEQESLRAEIAKLGDSHGSLENSRSELEKQFADATVALQQAEQDLEETRASLEVAQDQNASDSQEIERRAAAYEQLEREHADLDKRFAESSTALQGVERELTEARTELAASQDEVTTLVAEIGNRDELYASLEQERLKLEQQLSETNRAMKGVAGDLDATRADLQKARDDIASLTSEIGERDKTYALLEKDHAQLRQQLDETTAALSESQSDVERARAELQAAQEDAATRLELAQQAGAADLKAMHLQLTGAEKYADTLRFKLQAFTETESQWAKEHVRLNETIDAVNQRNQQLSDDLDAANESIAALKAASEQQQSDHEQEIRTLRFELGEAQETATQTADLNTDLASELTDTRNSKVDIERLLSEKEEEAQQRIAALDKELKTLTSDREELEQKLLTKSEALNVLLGELAKKTAQLESIGEVEEVIQDIDNRMSGRIDEPARENKRQPDKVVNVPSDRDRHTRVLIGNFGDRELRFPLFKKRLTIGRVEENDIQLKTSYISRRHAMILNDSDAARIIDSNSKNGVFVNSKRVKEHTLTNGDKVSIGNVKFRYEERPKRDT